MDIERKLRESLSRAIDHAGNMLRLSEKSGVAYYMINRFNSGKSEFSNMTLGTLNRLFPDMKLYCFRDEYPSLFRRNSVEIGGNMSGEIAQEGDIRKSIRNEPAFDTEKVDIKEFRLRLKQSNKFSAEERLKILDFLDEEL